MLAPPRKGGHIRTLSLVALLAVVWLLWSGLTVTVDLSGAGPMVGTDGLLLAFMVGSVAVTVWIASRMDTVDRESVPIRVTGRFLVYLPWLVKEIVLSNLHVASVILDRDLPIQPRLVRVKASQATDLGRVMLANSITITPGTVSLDIRDGVILVHALTANTAEGVLSGEMDGRVTWVEGAR